MNNIRYVITAINKSGQRELGFHKWSQYTHDTPELAQKKLEDVLANNSEDKIFELVGSDLQVRPVECYASNEPTTWYFDN